MKFTLRTKLIGLTTFVVTITMANVMYFFTIRELRDKGNAVESQMERIARNIASMQLLERQSWNDYQNYISQLMPFNEDIVYIAIYDDRNLLRAHTLNTDFLEVEDPAMLSQRARAKLVRRLDQGLIAEQSRKDLRTQKVNIQSGDRVLGSVHVGFSLIDINDEQQKRIWRNVIMAIVFIVFFSTIAMLLSRRLSRPLERLSQAMTSIAEGHPEQKVEVESKDEIGQLAGTFNEMVEGLRERKIIENLGQEMSTSFQLDRLANVVRNRLREAINADSARLFLREKHEKGVYKEITSDYSSANTKGLLRLDDKTNAFLRNDSKGFVIDAAPSQVKNPLADAQARPKDLLIPMSVKNQLLGFLIFGMKRQSQKFDPKQCTFTATLAGQAAIALENALLYDELREQEKIKRELEIAHEVQQKLLPEQMPDFCGFQFEGICVPALEIGGDYFDFFRISRDRLGIVIVDVSGKGTSASFYMAEIKGMMSSMAYIYKSPKKVICELNKRLFKSVDRKVFATMIYGVLDANTRKFAFVRAGHDSLFHIRAHDLCEVHTPPGIGVGLEPGQIFAETLQESEVALAKGDSILLFTDGITESRNPQLEEFGEERLLCAIRDNSALDARQLRDRILKEIETFTEGAQQHDDVTMLIIHNA